MENIKAVGHDGKLRRSYDKVKYQLVGPNKKSFFAVTETEVYHETNAGSEKVELPEQLNLAENRLTKISQFGKNYVFETFGGGIFCRDTRLVTGFEEHQETVVKFVHKEHIRA